MCVLLWPTKGDHGVLLYDTRFSVFMYFNPASEKISYMTYRHRLTEKIFTMNLYVPESVWINEYLFLKVRVINIIDLC